MKGFAVVLPICIFLCAALCVSFVHEGQVMAISVTPNSVVIAPEQVAVEAGKRVSFTATVHDSNNHKIPGLKLAWTLTTVVTGCTINPQTGVMTVAVGAPVGTYANLVQVAVVNYPSIIAQAQVNIITAPFSGGVFIGTHECTSGCDDSDIGELAIHATATTFKGLVFDGDGGGFEKMTGTIDKYGNLSAAVTSDGDKTLITGSVAFTDGSATGISGTWTNVTKQSSGTWTLNPSTVSGAGPKVGTWSVPGKNPPTGPLGIIFNDDTTLSGIVPGKSNAKDFSGTWTSVNGGVSFTMSGGNTVASGNGTYYPAHKDASGNLLNSDSIKVGTWRVSDL